MGPLAIFDLAILGLRGQLRMGRKIARGNRWVARKVLRALPMSEGRRSRYSDGLDKGVAKLDHFYERGTHFVDKFAKTTGVGTIPSVLTLGLSSFAKAGKFAPLIKRLGPTRGRQVIRTAIKFDRTVNKVNRFIPVFKIPTTNPVRRAAFKALSKQTSKAAAAAAATKIGGRVALKQVAKVAGKRLRDPRTYVNVGPDGLMNAGLGYLQTGDASAAASAFVTPEGRTVGGVAGLATKHLGRGAGKLLDRRLDKYAPDDPRHRTGARGMVNRSLARVHTGAKHAAGHATRLTGVDDMASLAAHATNLGVHSHAGIANGAFTPQGEAHERARQVASGETSEAKVNEQFYAMMEQTFTEPAHAEGLQAARPRPSVSVRARTAAQATMARTREKLDFRRAKVHN